MKGNAWDLYRRCFKEGDEVIVIDDDDRVFWGKLNTEELGITLRHAKRSHFLYWEDVRFMSHDGFPVRRLVGADGDPSILKEKSAKDAIRAALTKEFSGREDKSSYWPTGYRRPIPSFRGRFGDPFDVLVPCEVELYNSGNTGWYWYGQDYEECLVLTAPDGARAQLFDLSTVFYAEVA